MLNFTKKIKKTRICPLFNTLHAYLEKIVHRLSSYGVRADAVTLGGMGFAVIGLNFTAMEAYFAAFICFVLNRLCDVLDGMLARRTQASLFGAFLDIFADYVSSSLFIFGFVLAVPQNNASAGAFYLVSMIVSAVSLLAFAMISGENYRTLTASRLKICRWGNLQTLDNFAALFFMLLLPQYFMPIALFFGLLTFGKSLLLISNAYYKLEIVPKVKNHHEAF